MRKNIKESSQSKNYPCISVPVYWSFTASCLSVEDIQFVRELKNVKINELPATATLECELSKEVDSVQWLKNGQPIKRGIKYDIVADGRVHRLVINEVDDEDDAEYTIVVKSKTSKANVYVEG